MRVSLLLFAATLLISISSCEKEDFKPENEEEYTRQTFLEPGHLLYKQELFTIEGIKKTEVVFDTSFKDSLVVYRKYEYEYSKENIIFCKRTYSPKGIILYQTFYNNEFDDRGNLTLSHDDDLDPNRFFCEFEYNESNQMIKMLYGGFSNYHYFFQFHYDINGNMTTKEIINPVDSSLWGTTTYIYNNNKQITNLSHTEVNNDTPWKEIDFFYDNNNYLVKVDEIKSVDTGNGTNEKLPVSINYKRDNIGRPIEIMEDYKELYTSYEYSSNDFYPIESILGKDYYYFLFSTPF